MIIVALPSKPFTYTAKNTPRRQAILASYNREIEDLYTALNVADTRADVPPPSTWDLDSVTRYVKTVIGMVLDRDLGDFDDFFNFGCDRYVTNDLTCCNKLNIKRAVCRRCGFVICSSVL